MEHPYTTKRVNSGRGEQFETEFLRISRNDRMPAIVVHERQGIEFEEYPNTRRWYETMNMRPALRRGFDVGIELRCAGTDPRAKEILFGQQATPRA